MTHNHHARIRKALDLLKKTPHPAILIVSSNPPALRSRDQSYPYRANSDLYYLTGSHARNLTLVLRSYGTPSVALLAPPVDPVKVLWEGAEPSAKTLASDLEIELIVTKDPTKHLLSLARGAQCAYTQSIVGTPSFELRNELSKRPGATLRGLPIEFQDVESFTSTLRAFKDREEIQCIRRSAELTGEALRALVPHIRPGMSEREAGAFLDYYYRINGAEPAYGTIVGTGKSAATLHYHALTRRFRSGELVLIDSGAELDMYAADVTRTFAVDDKLSPVLADLHGAVCAAEVAAIKTVRHGILIRDVYEAAAKELVYGLKQAGVLKGPISKLMTDRAFRPYFPHGIGHALGIDVHDVGPLYNNPNGRLEKGMVFTIEPGLYFPKPIGKVPACGIRIEDDILVKASGAENLTSETVPIGLADLETLRA